MQQVCLRSDCRVNQEKWLWCNCRWWAQRFRLRNLMTAARRELTSISPLIERYCVVAEESKTSASYEICWEALWMKTALLFCQRPAGLFPSRPEEEQILHTTAPLLWATCVQTLLPESIRTRLQQVTFKKEICTTYIVMWFDWMFLFVCNSNYSQWWFSIIQKSLNAKKLK